MKKIDISKIKHTFAGGAILTNQKHVLITILVFLEFLLISFGYISYGNKNLDKYIIGKSTSDSSLFAIMLEDSTGEYKQSTTSTFPGYEYFYNQSKSGCMNNSGKQIKDSLLYDQDNKKATVNVSETSMCYLYFDKYKSTSFSDELIASNTLWQSNLEGDGYRFTGSGNATASTSPKNFICFGTTDKDTCTSNPSTYMYRIIGVFADENGDNHVKLIKYTQLPTAYAWNEDSFTDTYYWAGSDLYKGLNGSYFLTNTTYSYMQDNTWLSKITDWKWTAVNTLTNESSGLSYTSATAQNIYLHEMNRTGKTSTIGKWRTPTAKVGLMYVSDYVLSLGQTALSITTGTYDNRAILKTGWMHQSNNDTTASGYEWTISSADEGSDGWEAWNVDSTGYAYCDYVFLALSARPVLYLESYVSKSSGSGSLSDPYIIGTPSGNLSVSLSNSGSTLTATITKGIGNLNKYCINTSSSITNCTWNNITSTSITYTMPDYGTYYVHVIDDAGYIAHSSLTYTPPVPLATTLINSGNLWQSGLEGDGYRVTGTGVTCSYDNGNFFAPANNQSTTPTCPTLYNYTRTKISDSTTATYTYQTSCPSDTSTYTYSCTKLTAESMDSSSIPDNFICFGATDKDTCTANPSTYMYRIIGVFADENGDNHVKLIKYTQLGAYAWHSSMYTDTDWADSNLYKGLNGSYFLTNTKYSYMQDNTWLSKITNWKWTAVNTLTDESSGPDYYSLSPSNIYLHEMNRTGKTSTIGEWTTPTAKIGLMYVSDYALSLGATALSMTTGTGTNSSTLKTGWLNPLNNDTTAGYVEWTISRHGSDGSYLYAWFAGGFVSAQLVVSGFGSRPVFYLTSDVTSSSGTGTLSDPYILDVS